MGPFQDVPASLKAVLEPVRKEMKEIRDMPTFHVNSITSQGLLGLPERNAGCSQGPLGQDLQHHLKDSSKGHGSTLGARTCIKEAVDCRNKAVSAFLQHR